MDLSPADQRLISQILRVNHAGESGAIHIYRSQIWLTRRDRDLSAFLRHTLEHERSHLRRFRSLMPPRRSQPCGALPLWGLGGDMLGLITGLLGGSAVMICTEAVERTVHRHLVDQLTWLADRDPELSTAIREIQVEELEHLHFAESHGQPTPWTRLLDAIISGATEALIWLSTYGASARMSGGLRRASQD